MQENKVYRKGKLRGRKVEKKVCKKRKKSLQERKVCRSGKESVYRKGK